MGSCDSDNRFDLATVATGEILRLLFKMRSCNCYSRQDLATVATVTQGGILQLLLKVGSCCNPAPVTQGGILQLLLKVGSCTSHTRRDPATGATGRILVLLRKVGSCSSSHEWLNLATAHASRAAYQLNRPGHATVAKCWILQLRLKVGSCCFYGR